MERTTLTGRLRRQRVKSSGQNDDQGCNAVIEVSVMLPTGIVTLFTCAIYHSAIQSFHMIVTIS